MNRDDKKTLVKTILFDSIYSKATFEGILLIRNNLNKY